MFAHLFFLALPQYGQTCIAWLSDVSFLQVPCATLEMLGKRVGFSGSESGNVVACIHPATLRQDMNIVQNSCSLWMKARPSPGPSREQKIGFLYSEFQLPALPKNLQPTLATTPNFCIFCGRVPGSSARVRIVEDWGCVGKVWADVRDPKGADFHFVVRGARTNCLQPRSKIQRDHPEQAPLR